MVSNGGRVARHRPFLDKVCAERAQIQLVDPHRGMAGLLIRDISRMVIAGNWRRSNQSALKMD